MAIKGIFNGMRLQDGRLSIKVRPSAAVSREDYIMLQDMPVVIISVQEYDSLKETSNPNYDAMRIMIATISNKLSELMTLLHNTQEEEEGEKGGVL